MTNQLVQKLRRSRGIAVLVALAAALALSTAATTAVTAQTEQTINACYGKKAGKLRVIKSTEKCKRQETPISWSQNGQGPAGADGKTVLSGGSVPSSNQGKEGDFYIDTAKDEIYGPKTASGWGNPTPLVGPQGPLDRTVPTARMARRS